MSGIIASKYRAFPRSRGDRFPIFDSRIRLSICQEIGRTANTRSSITRSPIGIHIYRGPQDIGIDRSIVDYANDSSRNAYRYARPGTRDYYVKGICL